jgi:hypothetical protein
MKKEAGSRGPYKTAEGGLPKRRKATAVANLRKKALDRKRRLDLAKRSMSRKDRKLKAVIAQIKELKEQLKTVGYLFKNQELEKQEAIRQQKALQEKTALAEAAMRSNLDAWVQKISEVSSKPAKKKFP